MTRTRGIVGLVAVVLIVGLPAQQMAKPVVGKWEVSVDGQPMRIADLSLDGTAVKGTITKSGSAETVAVIGELRKVDLIFWTPEKEETFGVIVRDGEPVQGTHIYCPPGQPRSPSCSKRAVTMKRPAK
jgi:hypothetical protein